VRPTRTPQGEEDSPRAAPHGPCREPALRPLPRADERLLGEDRPDAAGRNRLRPAHRPV